jgi:hypothetical protein
LKGKTSLSEGILRVSDAAEAFLTRDQGRVLRMRLEAMMASGGRVIVDLTGAQPLTPSFADEFLGRLLLTIGPSRFRDQVVLRSESLETRRLVNKVLAHRLKEYNDARHETDQS